MTCGKGRPGRAPHEFDGIGGCPAINRGEIAACYLTWQWELRRMATREDAVERGLEHLLWNIIAVVAAVVLAALLVSNFYLDLTSFAAPIGACLALTTGSWFYRRWRPDPRVAAGLESTAQLIAFTTVGAPLSYLAAAADLPLRDRLFNSIDRALGLDWTALLTWMNAQVALHPAFAL